MKKLETGKRYWLNYTKTASGVFMGNYKKHKSYRFNKIKGEHNLNYYTGTDIIGFGIIHNIFQEVENA